MPRSRLRYARPADPDRGDPRDVRSDVDGYRLWNRRREVNRWARTRVARAGLSRAARRMVRYGRRRYRETVHGKRMKSPRTAVRGHELSPNHFPAPSLIRMP